MVSNHHIHPRSLGVRCPAGGRPWMRLWWILSRCPCIQRKKYSGVQYVLYWNWFNNTWPRRSERMTSTQLALMFPSILAFLSSGIVFKHSQIMSQCTYAQIRSDPTHWISLLVGICKHRNYWVHKVWDYSSTPLAPQLRVSVIQNRLQFTSSPVRETRQTLSKLSLNCKKLLKQKLKNGTRSKLLL